MTKNIHYIDIYYLLNFWTAINKLAIVYERFIFSDYKDGDDYLQLAEEYKTTLDNMSSKKRKKLLDSNPKIKLNWLLINISENEPIGYDDIELLVEDYDQNIGSVIFKNIACGDKNKKQLLSKINSPIYVINRGINGVSLANKKGCNTSAGKDCYIYKQVTNIVYRLIKME